MAVYVDDLRIAFSHVETCHMTADSHKQLVAMARTLGLKDRWLRCRGTPREYHSLSKLKRILAVYWGAIEIPIRSVPEIVAEVEK